MAAPATIVLTIDGAGHCRDELEHLSGVQLRERYDLGGSQDERRLADGLRDAWAVIAGSERYSRAVLQATSSLRAIVRWGTGTDAIDLDAATAAGVAVVTTPGANAEAVADMALALMLTCLRRLPELDAAVRAGAWRAPQPARDLAGATVGVVGLGAVGQAVVTRLRGFGCDVIALEPRPDRAFCAAHGVQLASLEQLLARVDVLTLHAPLTDSTRGLLGARELALLAPHAVLVNTARGQLIDQRALVEALRERRIAAAGLDVFEQEPLGADDPLTGLANVVLTGHVSSFTRLGLHRTGAAVVAHLQELLAGRLPSSCLNPEAWA
jgi:phosphoglycerate dehydrogenase-like enzyme